MALENVRVEYRGDVTINLGNFENFKPGYTISAEVTEGTTPSDARAQLKATVRRWLEEDIAEAKDD